MVLGFQIRGTRGPWFGLGILDTNIAKDSLHDDFTELEVHTCGSPSNLLPRPGRCHFDYPLERPTAHPSLKRASGGQCCEGARWRRHASWKDNLIHSERHHRPRFKTAVVGDHREGLRNTCPP